MEMFATPYNDDEYQDIESLSRELEVVQISSCREGLSFIVRNPISQSSYGGCKLTKSIIVIKDSKYSNLKCTYEPNDGILMADYSKLVVSAFQESFFYIYDVDVYALTPPEFKPIYLHKV